MTNSTPIKFYVSFLLVTAVHWETAEAVDTFRKAALFIFQMVKEIALEEKMHELVRDVVIEGHIPFTEHVGANEQNRVAQHVDQANLDYLFVESNLCFLKL